MGGDHTVTIRRDNTKKPAFVGFMLSLFSATAFLFEAIHASDKFWFFLAACLIQYTGIAWQMFVLRKGKKVRFRNWIWAAAVCWIAMPVLSWLFFPLIVLGFLEYASAIPTRYIFGHEIIRRSLGKKVYSWSDFQRIMVKDGLLSLDFRNNRLLQLEIADGTLSDEAEFNRFCREKIVNLRQ